MLYLVGYIATILAANKVLILQRHFCLDALQKATG